MTQQTAQWPLILSYFRQPEGITRFLEWELSKDQFLVLLAGPHEISSRVLGLLCSVYAYCTVHVQLLSSIWVSWNLLRDFSGSRRLIFKFFEIIRFDDWFLNFFYIIRFVFSLAFQHRIRNCSMAKSRTTTMKTKHEVKTMAWLFFIYWVHCNFFTISQAPDIRFLNFLISLDLSFH